MKRIDQLRAVKAYRDSHENLDDIDKALVDEEQLYASKFLREELYTFLAERLSDLSISVTYNVEFTPEHGLTITMPEDDVQPEQPDVPIEPLTPTHTKQWPNAIRVKYPDGETLFYPLAVNTLAEVINRVGPERVAALQRELANGRQFVSKDNQGTTRYKPLNEGWFVWANTSTEAKAEQIRDLSNVFRLDLEVEVLPRPKSK